MHRAISEARQILIEAVLDYLCANAQEHRIRFRWRPFLPDPDDDFILELAVAAKAKYIVTHKLRDFAGVEAFGLEAITPLSTKANAPRSTARSTGLSVNSMT